MKSFTNKVAAITGAASGIGRALAQELARDGCHLALSDLDPVGLEETAVSARAYGVTVTTQQVDVANREQMHAWAEQVVTDHGKVNLIFNNAGVAHSGSVIETEYDDYEWLLNINLWGVIHGTKAFLPHLQATGEGHVINISSIFGLFSQPGMSAYNTSKFAVRGFTEALRQELDLMGCGVSATCVHPGGIKTNIAKSARMSKGIHLPDSDPEVMRQKFHDVLLRTPPEKAAKVILDGVRRDARRVLIGHDARTVDSLQRLLPSLYQRLVTTSLRLVG